MRKKLVVGNWKMNGSGPQVTEIIEVIKKNIDLDPSVCQVVVCPPFTLLSLLQERVKDLKIAIGAQNVHSQSSGAYTGEISSQMLGEAGVTFCIIGHSERRSYFKETDGFIGEKLKNLLDRQIRPILCVGESLEQREQGSHESTVIQQLNKACEGITHNQALQCVIAYEPIWAIGTGKTATPEQANQMHDVIRKQLSSLFSKDLANEMSVLYGGSVKGDNAEELLRQSDIDGALVGGASLNPDDFCKIIRAGYSV